jgi:hypothetical protein
MAMTSRQFLNHRPRSRQRGAVAVTVAMSLLFLLGFMGLALDFGRLFVLKGELQTALDSCALAAAQELDGQSSSISRAVNAGIRVGNTNRIDFQSVNWSGKGQLVGADLSFKDAAYLPTTNPLTARYAQCEHRQTGVGLWLLQALGAFSGNRAAYPGTLDVHAVAEASRISAQSACPVPLALRPKTGGVAPEYGFSVGEWVTLLSKKSPVSGQIGWANLDGTRSASETEAEMDGFCGTRVGDTLGTPGTQSKITESWNARFGIYKNSGGVTDRAPDYTGYAYTRVNWPTGRSAFNGSKPAGAPASAENFLTKRLAFASCADTGTSVSNCEVITGIKLDGGFKTVAPPGQTSGGHRDYGASRRLVIVPVTDASSKVIDYVCMLMLEPLGSTLDDVQLEFLGHAGSAGVPCTTSGLPGGSVGPLVSALVR